MLSKTFFFVVGWFMNYFKVLPEINTYAHKDLCLCEMKKVEEGKQQRRKRENEKQEPAACCTCIRSICLHIFGCKYVYKKTRTAVLRN